MNTFGPIDWHKYYKTPKPPLPALGFPPFPCGVCQMDAGCIGRGQRGGVCAQARWWMYDNWDRLCMEVRRKCGNARIVERG